MEIERIEKVKITPEEEAALDKVSAIMNDITRYSEDDVLIGLASVIADYIKDFYEFTTKQY